MPANYFHHLAKIEPTAPMPFSKPEKVGILIEVAATADRDSEPDENGAIPVQAMLEETLGHMMEAGEVLDATLAQNENQRLEFWRQREKAFEICNSQGVPITTDISVPLDKVEEFLSRAEIRLSKIAPKAELIEIAHLGDGNLHYSMWVDTDTQEPASKEMQTAIYSMVEDVVGELKGSFSAEHGIGISKLGSMARHKDQAALGVMRAIKTALDPNNIMNPGKVLP